MENYISLNRTEKRVENSWIQTESARYYAGTNGILKRNCWFAKQFFDNNGCVAQDAVLPRMLQQKDRSVPRSLMRWGHIKQQS